MHHTKPELIGEKAYAFHVSAREAWRKSSVSLAGIRWNLNEETGAITIIAKNPKAISLKKTDLKIHLWLHSLQVKKYEDRN